MTCRISGLEIINEPKNRINSGSLSFLGYFLCIYFFLKKRIIRSFQNWFSHKVIIFMLFASIINPIFAIFGISIDYKGWITSNYTDITGIVIFLPLIEFYDHS